MKSFLILLISFFLQAQTLPQQIYGYVKNNALQGLESKLVEVYMTINGNYVVGSDLTASNGYFVTGTYTDVDEEQAQIEGIVYSASNNSANIEINSITTSNVIIKLYDITGQEVYKFQGENTGKKIYSLPVAQFANALYISMVTVNGRTDVNKILNIDNQLYFGKTSSLIKKNSFNKNSLVSTLDSIIVSGYAIHRTTFTFGVIVNSSYDVGELFVDSAYVSVTGRVYKLMEWQEPNNGLEGASIQIGNQNMITGTDGVFNFVIPSGINDVLITHENIYQRQTKLNAEKDTTINFDILDKTNFPEDLMANLDTLTMRIIPQTAKTFRWKQVPIFYIVADTNNVDEKTFYQQQKSYIEQHLKPGYIGLKYPEGFIKNAEIMVGTNPPSLATEGYYLVKQDTTLPAGGIANTGVYRDTEGIIYSAITIYLKGLSPQTMDRITIHELASGMNNVTRTDPYDNILSVFDMGPPIAANRFTPADYKMLLFLYNRPGGVLRPDTDDGWEGWP